MFIKHSYPTRNNKGNIWLRGPTDIIRFSVRHAHSFNYNLSAFDENWNTARQYVALMVSRSMSISQSLRGKHVPLGNWGFKHPRTALLLPYWEATLGDKFLFIHVIRDGKDVIEGDNQKIFESRNPFYFLTMTYN